MEAARRRARCSCAWCQTGTRPTRFHCAGVLPKEFSFKPSDSELVNYYLKNMVITNYIIKLDIYRFASPDQIRELWTQHTRKNSENMYVLTPIHKLTPNGRRVDRSTPGGGYWKTTSKPTDITDASGKVTGVKHTLVWYQKKLQMSAWIMDEYTLHKDHPTTTTDPNDMMVDEVLCNIHKTGRSANDDTKTNGEAERCQQQQPKPQPQQPGDDLDQRCQQAQQQQPSVDLDQRCQQEQQLSDDLDQRCQQAQQQQPIDDLDQRCQQSQPKQPGDVFDVNAFMGFDLDEYLVESINMDEQQRQQIQQEQKTDDDLDLDAYLIDSINTEEQLREQQQEEEVKAKMLELSLSMK